MKIGMITADYLPNIGGITSHIAEISRSMAKRGHTVCIWYWDRQDRDAVLTEGVQTELLKPEPCDRWPHAIRYSFTLAKILRERIAVFEPEILHVHTLAPLSLCMRWLGPRSDYRRILTNHSSGYLRMIQSWVGRHKAKFYCGAFDGIIAPSKELLDKSSYLGLSEKRCRYIPNGVDTSKFAPSDRRAARSLLNIPDSRFVLLTTRRFAIKNGLRYLAQAVDILRKEIPNVLCVFCGDAYDDEELHVVRTIANERGLKDFVRLEGAVPNDKIKDYLGACDVVVLPSLVEATSISALEAMAAAKPVVGTRVGGITELIVEGVTGTLVEPADAVALSEGIVRTVKEYDLKVLGRAARQRVLEHFTWDKIADQTVEFYRLIQTLSLCRHLGAGWYQER